MDLSGISAVVTGGASGLGEATARTFAAAGAKVALFDMNLERGQAVAAEIGGIALKVNVANEADVIAALDAAEAAHGTPRILVNCAGIGDARKTVAIKDKTNPALGFVPHDLAAFRRTIEVNLIGSFTCITHAAARMAALAPIGEERGVIINTASVAAYDGQIGQASYSASKGGIVGMTLPIARDLASSGIRVMTIAPGLFLTPLLMGLPEPARESLGKQVPFPSRLGNPVEYGHLAKAIVENPMLNGEVIRLDGAIRMAPK
jgi:NAD(P)-dependent dehydrogenase (short-subunit alcohol dehydrogenase family)